MKQKELIKPELLKHEFFHHAKYEWGGGRMYLEDPKTHDRELLLDYHQIELRDVLEAAVLWKFWGIATTGVSGVARVGDLEKK
jgi:hypothetical protein